MGICDPNLYKYKLRDLLHMREYILQMIVFEKDLLKQIDTKKSKQEGGQPNMPDEEGTNSIKKHYLKTRLEAKLKEKTNLRIKS